MSVRVIRILEYTYPDFETAEKDMERWTNNIPYKDPVNGLSIMNPEPPYKMRTVSLPIMTVNDVDHIPDGYITHDGGRVSVSFEKDMEPVRYGSHEYHQCPGCEEFKSVKPLELCKDCANRLESDMTKE